MNDETSIGRRLVQNSGLIAAARILTAATSLAAVPVVIGKLGVAGFGSWEALFAAASLLGIFQGALSGTLLWRLSEAFGRGRRDEAAQWVRFGMAITLLLFLTLVPAAWAGSPGIVSLLNIPEPFTSVSVWIFPRLVAITVLGGVADALEAVVSGHQRAGVVSLSWALALIVNYGLVVIGILAGWGLVSCLIGVGGGLVVRSLAAFYFARGALGRLSLLPGRPPGPQRATMRYSALLLVGYVSGSLKDQADRLILATLASPTWTGYYGIASRLAGLVLEFSRFFYNPLLAATAALNAQHNWPAVRRMYDAAMTVVPLATGCVVVAVAGLYDRLLVLWLGRYLPDVPVLLLLLLTGNAFGTMLTGPGTALSRGIGKVWIETAYVVINLMTNLILTLVLVLSIGPVGTVMASGASWALSSIVFAFMLHRAIDLPSAATRRAAGALACAALAGGMIRVVSVALPPSTSRPDAVVALLGLGVLATGMYAALLAATGVVSRATIVATAAVLSGRHAESVS